MRFKTVFAALAVCVAPSAYAQDKPIYFVVDASGSMAGQNKADAELLLRALSLTRDQPVSVTYFGRKPTTPGTNLCFEDLDVQPPVPRGNDFSPELEGLGGKDDQTAITNAIDKVLEKIEGPAKLIVVTDGQEGCNRHFDDILARHPGAEVEIDVRQVGNSPNAELQKLGQPPLQDAVVPPTTPLINLEFRAETPTDERNAWEAADWLARYFWLLPYLLLALAAWFFGSSYGKKAQRYEAEIEKLQDLRRTAAEHFARTGTRFTGSWPAFLAAADVTTDGAQPRKASLALFLLSCAAGVPLVFLSGGPEAAAVATKIAVPVLILLLLYVGPRVWSGRLAPKSLPTTRNVKIAVAIGVIAISAAHFLMDGEKARGAAWVVLGSGFSAALAIVASAPLLFAGSRLGKLDRIQNSYKSTWDHGIDETHRQDMAEAQKRQAERDHLLSSFAGWLFPPSTTNARGRYRGRSLQKDKDAVRNYVGMLVRQLAEHAKKANDNTKLSALLHSGGLVGSIRAAVETPELKLPDHIKAALLQVADACDSNVESKISQAFSAAVKMLPAK